MDKVTRPVSTNHNLSEEKGEPKRYRTEVLPLTSLSNALPLGGKTRRLTHAAISVRGSQLSVQSVSRYPSVSSRLWRGWPELGWGAVRP